jgi:hypothetical protein
VSCDEMGKLKSVGRNLLPKEIRGDGGLSSDMFSTTEDSTLERMSGSESSQKEVLLGNKRRWEGNAPTLASRLRNKETDS